MANFYGEVLEVLKQDTRFLAEDGTLLRNAVYEAAMQMDEKLLTLLLSNESTKARFFKEMSGITVFDKIEFGWVVNNREFLPDSYTRYKNKIGLADGNGDMITASGKVELVFPYKDCVLEGGQTKEDQKRAEIFYNETLAPDEVDRLLFPKVFVKAQKFNVQGNACINNFVSDDNLVIKGNNLLAISSLLKRYEGEIKLIYIDVPYNTGNDSFGYNDRFNHSSWLCFIKSRLEIAYKLLNTNGTIAISVDNYELAYILILLDEIFGKENRKNIITVKRGSVTGAKVINPGVVNVVEYVVLYAKNSDSWNPNRVFAAKGYDDRYSVWINNRDKSYEEWTFSTVLEEWAKIEGVKKSELKRKYGDTYDDALNEFVLNHLDNIGRWASLDANSVGEDARSLKKKSQEEPDKVFYLYRENVNDYYIKNGNILLFATDRVRKIDGNLSFSQPISDIWDDVLPNDLHNEGGVELRKGKKPEKLISRILELCTNEGDMVLDFFAGSGTTGAVALKMNRRFILCEQLEYIENTTCQRLINVINGEMRGVSSTYDWQGGGSFIYCELAKANQNFVDEIQDVNSLEAIKDIYERIIATGFISSKVNPRDIDVNADDFNSLSLEDQKRFLMELLDKNLLYVNYCDIDDEEFAISDTDKAFTRSFYGEV